MTTRRLYLIIALVVVLLLFLTVGLVLMRSPSDTVSVTSPAATILGCCQCTAIGNDQGYPYEKVSGYTCDEYCYQGCLERDNSEIVCKLGSVGGYELACPDVLLPTVTPYGE
jgi:hypothetical protein